MEKIEHRTISIVLCTYNRAHTLRESIDSILAQTFEDFELIIVDDGSTDNTLELLKEYKDDRIRVFAQKENQSYCIAANYGMKQIRGDYVAFATSDDLWEPKKLKRQMEILERSGEYGACFTFSDVIDEDGRPADGEFEMISGLLMASYHTQREWIQRFIFEGNCLCHPSAVIRRSVIEEVGLFNIMYCQSADMDLWLRIARRYPLYVIEERLVHYRCYKNPAQQISGADELKEARFFNEHMLIRRNFIEDLSEEELVAFFGDCFRKPDARTHLELEIERVFLLMNCARHIPNLRILGIEKLEKLLKDPETLRVLKESYGLGIKDIYEWNREHFYTDFGIHVRLAELDRVRTELREQTLALTVSENDREKKRERIEELERLLDKAALEILQAREERSENKKRKGVHIWRRGKEKD